MPITEKTKKELSKEFQALLKHSHKLLEATSGEVDEQTKMAREKLQESLDAAKARYEALEDRVHSGLENTDRYIKDKPYHALGITFAAGLLLGWIMRRK